MIEPESSVQSRGGDSPEKDSAKAETGDQHSPKRVLGSGSMIMEGDSDENRLRISEIVDEIYGGMSSIVEYSLQWKVNNEELKRRALEVEVKEKSVMEKIVELEKKEERLREVEERERKIGLLEKSVTLTLEELEKERLINELVGSIKQLKEGEKELRILGEAIKERMVQVEKKVEVIEAKEEEFRVFDQALREKLTEVEKKEKELRLFEESLKEKWTDLEKKEESFETKAEEMEQKGKFLELREKKLEEMVKEFELKQRGLQKPSTGAETSQRSRVKLLVEKSNEADYLIYSTKRHKSRKEYNRIDDVDEDEKETELV